MYNYNKNQVSPYDPTKLAVLSILRPVDDLTSKFGQNFNKTVSYDDIVHFIDEDNIVKFVDFAGGFAFFPEIPTKPDRSDGNYVSRFWGKPQCIPSSNQHNCFFDDQHTTSVSLKPWNLWELVPETIIPLNHPNDRDSMTNQYPQPTTHQLRTDSYPVLHSMRAMDSKKKVLHVNFGFIQWNYLPDGRVNQIFSTVEELSDHWKLGAMDAITSFVMSCICF